MTRHRLRIVELVFIAAAAAVSWISGPASQATVLAVQTTLIGFAGLVVTIFGIWIAVIFPVLSGLLVDGKARQEVSQLARYDVLVRALYRACFALTVSFFIYLLISFGNTWNSRLAHWAMFFSWLVFVATAWALWSAIWNGESAVSAGVNESVKIGLVRRVRGMGRKSRRGKGSAGAKGDRGS